VEAQAHKGRNALNVKSRVSARWVELLRVDQGGLVFAIVDLVAQAFGAFDDGADGGVDEASGVQAHGDTVADVALRRAVWLFLSRHADECNIQFASESVE
jgi:hypothetical protein